MATETGHNNVFHTDYKGDWIRLDNFRPPTVNTNQLLRYLIRESKNMIFHNADGRKAALTHLLENHMLPYLPTSIVNDGQVMVTALPKTTCMDFIQSWLHLDIVQASLSSALVCSACWHSSSELGSALASLKTGCIRLSPSKLDSALICTVFRFA